MENHNCHGNRTGIKEEATRQKENTKKNRIRTQPIRYDIIVSLSAANQKDLFDILPIEKDQTRHYSRDFHTIKTIKFKKKIRSFHHHIPDSADWTRIKMSDI